VSEWGAGWSGLLFVSEVELISRLLLSHFVNMCLADDQQGNKEGDKVRRVVHRDGKGSAGRS
jgi:hypothetical protein